MAIASTLRLPRLGGLAQRLPAVGDWLLRHQAHVRGLQWAVLLVYALLVVVPAFLPPPARHAHLWSSLTLMAQFAFWGIWWPFVLLSMVVVGRAWCGFFCPEGALSEWASRKGRGGAVPRWLRWGGWPPLAFVCTTVYGQLLSVYQYPKPALLILGGSTLAAVAVGWLYGRNKRVWCRYLCPVSGVFTLLAKLAPLHFRVDPEAWQASQRRHDRALAPVNCAPMVAIRTMRGAGSCHMCGRCSGFRDAVSLSLRSPNHEIVAVAGSQASPRETVLILFGLLGTAVGAFLWPTSPFYVAAKQALAEALLDHGIRWPLEATLPWWLLTNVPERHEVLTLLDGAVLLGFIATATLVMGGGLLALLSLATAAAGRWSWARLHHLAQALIPLAGGGVFLGLSALTVSLLRAEGLALPWVGAVRAGLLAGAALWSAWLAWQVAGRYAAGARRLACTAAMTGAVALGAAAWAMLFWG